MQTEIDEQDEREDGGGIKEGISGLGQKILGEIETIGGVLTGDPVTQAEGEFNVEVGTAREEIEEDLEDAEESRHRDAERRRQGE